MAATLETLELTAAELATAKEMISKLAYQRWLDAGQPDGRDVEFWAEAEREWLAYDYVPHRDLVGGLTEAMEARTKEPNSAQTLAHSGSRQKPR